MTNNTLLPALPNSEPGEFTAIPYDYHVSPMLQCPVLGDYDLERVASLLEKHYLFYHKEMHSFPNIVLVKTLPDEEGKPQYLFDITSSMVNSILYGVPPSACYVHKTLAGLLDRMPFDLSRFVIVDWQRAIATSGQARLNDTLASNETQRFSQEFSDLLDTFRL